MPAGHAQIDAADFHIGHLLGLDNGIADVLLHCRRVANLALTHAARFRLAESDDIQSRRVRIQFADDRADFRCADFQSDDDA